MPKSSFPSRYVSLFLVLSCLACHSQGQMGPKLAQMGDQKILTENYLSALRLEVKNYSPKLIEDPESFLKIKRQLLNNMVEDTLLLQGAKAAGVEVSETELKQEVLKYKSQYTELSFSQMLKEMDVSESQWEKSRRDQLILKKYLESQLRLRPELSPEKLREFYDKNLEAYRIPESVHIRQIVTDTKEKAESILRRLKNGENFAKLARDLSLSPDRKKGGDLGFITKGSFPHEFEVCFSMNPGEISPIIPSLYGFHLFKVLEKEPERLPSYEEVELKINLQLKQQLRVQVREDLLKKLREQTKVTTQEDLLKRITL